MMNILEALKALSIVNIISTVQMLQQSSLPSDLTPSQALSNIHLPKALRLDFSWQPSPWSERRSVPAGKSTSEVGSTPCYQRGLHAFIHHRQGRAWENGDRDLLHSSIGFIPPRVLPTRSWHALSPCYPRIECVLARVLFRLSLLQSC